MTLGQLHSGVNGKAAGGPRSVAKTRTICQLLHTLHVGGAEVLAARLARQLHTSCRFIFACLDELGTLGRELQGEGFTVEVLGRRAGLDWRCAWHLAQFLRREHVDLLHAHQYTPFFYAMMARLLYRRPPVLFTEHGRHFPDYPRRKRMWANRLLLERRDRVIGVGHAVRRAVIANEGIPAGRVDVIYNGIDLAHYADGNCETDAARAALGLRPDDFVILLVARLDYLKDHATAVRTMHRVVGRLPNARLLLVGEGPERTKIQELTDHYQLGANIRLLGLRQDIPKLLRATDLFLLTSISEGIPLTAIEAMAAGIPVVATQVGGMGEVVQDGATGLLAPSGDDVALAERLLRLAEQPKLREQMGCRGRQRADALFSESQMHDRYLQTYRAMLPA